MPSGNRTKAVVRLSVAACLAVTLAACSGSSDDPALTSTDASPEQSASPSATPAPSASASPSASPTPAGATGVANGLEPAPAAEPQVTLPPAPIGDPVVNEEGLKVLVVSFRDVETPAGAPGEIGGPGVAFDVTVVNNGSTPVDMSNVVADLRTGADLTPALRADREPTKPFTGTLAPGQTATATYAFTLPEADRADVTLILNINAETPTVVFRGSVQ